MMTEQAEQASGLDRTVARQIGYGRFLVEAYSDEGNDKGYTSNLPHLIPIVSEIDARVFFRPYEVAEDQMRKNMIPAKKKDETPERATVMLASVMDETAQLDSNELPKYIGFSTQTERTYTTEIGDIKLLYISTRAIDIGYRGEGLGRFFLQQCQFLHRDADIFAARSQSEIAIRSARASGVYNNGMLPFDSEEEGMYLSDPIAGRLLLLLSEDVRKNSIWLNRQTGLAIGEYGQPNQALVQDPIRSDRDETIKLQRKLERSPYNLDHERGDAIYYMGWMNRARMRQSLALLSLVA